MFNKLNEWQNQSKEDSKFSIEFDVKSGESDPTFQLYFFIRDSIGESQKESAISNTIQHIKRYNFSTLPIHISN